MLRRLLGYISSNPLIMLSNIWWLLKPGGTLVMIEAMLQGYNRMNGLREKSELPGIAIRWHNNYLGEEKSIPFLNLTFSNTILSSTVFSLFYPVSAITASRSYLSVIREASHA